MGVEVNWELNTVWNNDSEGVDFVIIYVDKRIYSDQISSADRIRQYI